MVVFFHDKCLEGGWKFGGAARPFISMYFVRGRSIREIYGNRRACVTFAVKCKTAKIC